MRHARPPLPTTTTAPAPMPTRLRKVRRVIAAAISACHGEAPVKSHRSLTQVRSCGLGAAPDAADKPGLHVHVERFGDERGERPLPPLPTPTVANDQPRRVR